MEPVIIGDATLYHGDCLEILPTLDKVDALVTSPPYAEQRDYGGQISSWDSMMDALIYSPDCQMLVNLGQVHRDGEVLPYWEHWRERMRSAGWRYFGHYVWDQCDGLPGNWNGRLAPSHEYILHFNRTARDVNKWVRVKRQRGPTGTGLRKKDGQTSGISSREKCGLSPYKVADSVIRVYREMRRGIDHPAIFPVRLPEELLMSFTCARDIALDPFMGSGTTGVACANLGRKFIGIEIEKKYFDIACERIDAAYAQGRLFD